MIAPDDSLLMSAADLAIDPATLQATPEVDLLVAEWTGETAEIASIEDDDGVEVWWCFIPARSRVQSHWSPSTLRGVCRYSFDSDLGVLLGMV